MKGTVFSVALNHRSQMEAWNVAFHQAPYLAPPQAPVWFIKPRNTLIAHLDTIPYPDTAETVHSGATLGLVIGKTAHKVSPEQVEAFTAGYLLANEISLPESSFYRPAIRAKCRDGFCPLGSEVKKVDPAHLTIITKINGHIVQEWHTGSLIRSAGQLLSALSDFATLQPGDILLLGTPHQRVALQPGDSVTVHVDGFTPLQNYLGEVA